MAIKKARPTEYRGCGYKSKSEAMFARWIDLNSGVGEMPCFDGCSLNPDGRKIDDYGFVYEPKWMEVDGWFPDFLVFMGSTQMVKGIPLPMMHYWIIEYKPSEPTKTYRDEFRRRCKTILTKLDNTGFYPFSKRSHFQIYFGSVFTKTRGIIGVENNVMVTKHTDWIGDHESAIRETRFDLCEATN